ncbi:MAG: PaREP1 family protein [Thaumarchaeota archaeon]|nr:PaREP1 family protein [Candidatus Geocrenenecus arthurdayi]
MKFKSDYREDKNMTSIVLPKRIEKKLKEESEKRGAMEEEIIIEALTKMLNEPLNPDEKTEIHLKLSEKYMDDAEEYLRKRDYIQASEKAWGAASQIVKALAAKEGRELRSHASLWEYMDELAERLRDKELRYLWGRANNLHQNFYENWMPSREVELAVDDVKMLIGKLKTILEK